MAYTGFWQAYKHGLFTGILRQLPELKNPTIVVQVDRNDLDKQLYENFVWKSLNNGDKLLLVNTALNHIVKDDEQCEGFMLAEKKMSALVNLITSHPLIQDISLDILFY